MGYLNFIDFNSFASPNKILLHITSRLILERPSHFFTLLIPFCTTTPYQSFFDIEVQNLINFSLFKV